MAEHPSGFVTFLFSDIEGSTRLWETYPQAMKGALARHDALMRQTFEAHRGYVFKSMGDAFCVAFPTAAEALTAATAAQRALQGEAWGEVGQIRVRMALHAGEADERDGDYFGPTLNRVARLMSAGHGGQILLTRVTADEVRARLEDGAALRDMGERRLKDLSRPEHLFQLVAPGLTTEFAPLKTLDARPNNLPIQPTALIGRDAELEQCRQHLRQRDTRLLSLTGPGGIGKTRLALQAAAEMVDEFEHGAFFVPLEIDDPALVMPTLAETLDVRESSGRSLMPALKEALSNKQMAILLDNFEHLIKAAPSLADLMAAAPRVKFLVTSRSVLRLRGEREIRIPTLSLPRGSRLPPLDELLKFPAIALFTQRARDARPDFELSEDNAAAVVEICRRLDGLPLAIELAAARVRVLAPQAILGRLENRLKLLTGGARDLPTRQQTLRGAIDWSYDLLGETEKKAFQRLSVFVGGCTLDTAEAVCNADGDLEADVLDEVTSLVEKSLLRQEETPDGETRFAMLQTIREYGAEQLAASGDAETTRRYHADYFQQLAKEAEAKLTGKEQAQWLHRLEAEYDNLRAALTWLAEEGDDTPLTALQMGGALWRFWATRGHLSEGRDRLAGLLDLPAPVLTAKTATTFKTARAKALQGAGTLSAQLGDYDAARGYYEESLDLRRELSDTQGMAALLNNLGILARFRGDLAAARQLYEESLALLRELNDRPAIAQAYNNLALVTREEDPQRARALLEESLTVRRALKDKWGIANSLSSLGDVLLDLGDLATARAVVRESLALNAELGDRRAIAYCLDYLASLAAAEGQAERALRLGGAADALRAELNAPLSPGDQARLDARLAPARETLGANSVPVWQEGGKLSIEDVIANEQP